LDEPSRDVSDASLLERVRAGDLDGFSELVRLHHRGVRVFIGAHVRDPAALDDLVQDVFLRAFQGLDRLRDAGAFRSWLLGIAHNRTLEHVRERLRVAVLDEGAFDVLLERSQAALLEGEDDEARRSIELEALQECMRRLPATGGRLIREYYFRGRPIAYLAEQEGKNEGAVRVMLFRLREMLRDCVRGRLAGRGPR
jgi:RNA polymerase sigma-70 factor (ECF subfamily)